MLVTKREAKQVSKKLLSVLMAVIMLMTTMTVGFATVASAAGGNATEAQWTALVNALKNDTVKGATFTGTANNYEVDDPDGKILAAIEAYYEVFNAMSNKNPTNRTSFGGNSDINRTGESTDTAKRTINQLNTTIKNELSSRMGADYTSYNVKDFLTGLLCGADISAGTSNVEITTQNASVPSTPLAAAPAVNLKVKLGSAVTGYTLEELKALTDGVVAEKTFTVTHANTNYDYAYDYTAATTGCTSTPASYKHTFYFYYNVNANVTAVDGDKISTTSITSADSTFTTYTDYFSKSMAELVATDATTLTNVSNTVSTAKQNVETNFSSSVFTHFFSGYAVDTLVNDITIAKEIQSVTPYTTALMNAVAAGYDNIIEDKTALTNLLSEIDANLQVYNNATPSAKTFINNNGYDGAAVATLRAGVVRAIELIDIRNAKAAADAHMATYNAYTTEQIDEGTLTNAMINAAKTVIAADVAELQAFDQDDVTDICGSDYYDTLAACMGHLSTLGTVAEYNEDFASRYATFAGQIQELTDVTADTDTLREGLKSYDGWYTGLKSLIDEMRTELGDDLAEALFDNLNNDMIAHMDDAYDALNSRVEAQIDAAYPLFTAYVDTYGEKVNMATVSEYRAMKNSIGLIDADAYNFLKNTANFDISDEAVRKYEAMQKDFPQYDQFLSSHGFATYEQSEIADIVRAEEEADGHDAHVGDYTVTDENVEKIINLIETLLADDDIKALLGDFINKDEDGNPTGEPFDLAALVTGLIEEKVFSDSLINTIIQFIYPAVANIFTEVWMGIDPWIDDPAMAVMGQTVSVKADLYLKTVEEATAGLGLPIFPDDLAAAINTNYSQFSAVADVLDDATTKAYIAKDADGNWDESTRKSPWDDAALYTDKVDADGNVVTDGDGNTTKVLNLNWGIDELEGAEKRERFLQAVQAALCGLEPILLALLCNTPMERFNANIGNGYGLDGLNGFGVGDIVIIQGLWEYKDTVLSGIELDIHTIDLRLEATANDGYNNVIAPLFELLGIAAPDGRTFTSSRAVIENGLLEPLDTFIAKLAADPIETILNILPNLTYAAEVDLLLTKLEYLATDISYSAGATINADLNNCTCNHGLISTLLPYLDGVVTDMTGLTCSGGVIQNVRSDDVMTDNLPVEIAGIIDIGELLGGADLSSFAGIWDMVMGMLGEDVTLPQPNAGYIATLGELTWKDTVRSEWGYTPTEGNEGKAAYIEANKADVLIYLLRYVLNALGENPDLLASLGLELSEDVQGIIAGVTANPDNTIAAIVELLNQVEYDTLKEYVWYVSELDEETVVGMTPAIQQYLGYDNDWTKTKADYIIDNVDNIIAAVMKMVGGEDAEPFEIGTLLSDLISGLFTNENITAIAKLLAKLDLNALLAGDKEEAEGEDEIATVEEDEEATEESALDINALVANFAGIDLSGFAAYAELADDYNWGFEDGDKDGFVNALVALLEPLQGVLDFILAGADLQLLDGGVKLVGYNGYDSAIVPILEALGATPAALQDGDNVLAVIIGALLARVESLDSVDAILDLIPGLLYFVKSNGLTTAVRNLLQPVLVILETIDPIYALNLNELIGGLTKDLGFTLNLDNLSFEAIFDILPAFIDLDLSELEEIIDDVCEVITPVTYTSASSLIGENGKKGAYGEYFDAADLVTVLVSFALSWLQEGDNANDIVALIAGDDAEKAEEIAKYINGAIVIINGIEPTYEAIDWDYNFPDGFDEAIFESGITIQPTINTITYPTNWTEDTAKYVADNLDEIADEVIGLVDENYDSLAGFIADKVTIYSTDNVNAIVDLVAGLLVDIDEVLVNTVGLVLGANIDALVAYEAPAGIDTAEEFAAALTDVLATIQPVVDWLLFGEDYAFFSKSGTDLVTIKGAEGYAYGLAPILEALGVAAPSKDEATVAKVLEAVFARVDAVLADPVNEVFDLLPNLIYFLNANGVSTSVKNLLAGVTALTDTISEEFGLEVNLMSVFNGLIANLLPEDSTVTLDVANLDLESIFKLVQELLGLDLTPIANILVDLCVGQIVAYTSASGEYGFKMLYTDDFARYDMITIIVSCLLQIIKLEANEEALKEMLGENVYEGILNVISLEVNVPVQDIEWIYTDRVGEEFNAIDASILFEDFEYGPLYTKEMEQYIVDNFGQFVDNIIFLLGININGVSVQSLTQLINEALNGGLYNSDMVITIRDAIAGLAGTLEESLPAGAHIIEILGTTGIADLKAIADVEVPEFTNDRGAFVAALCDVLEPLYGALNWLLADEDLTFFVDEELNTLITLPGAEGYAYGLIPVLEVLDCKGIIAPAEYYAAIENGDKDTVITSLLNPILDRVDEIINGEAAEEILSILPNLVYFINSNGVDTVIKNTLNAVYTLLNAIEPIAKVDLYELAGINFLEELTFTKLFDMLLEKIEEATGYDLEVFTADSIAELTMGKLEFYTSANGKDAYRMVYQAEGVKGEMVTVILRLLVLFLAHEKNQEAVLGILRDNLGMTAETEKYVAGALKAIDVYSTETKIGMDTALATIYYLFYGADVGVGGVTDGVKDVNEAWHNLLLDLGMSEDADTGEATIGNIIRDILDWGSDEFEDVLDTDAIAPNGFIRFFQKIAEWFNRLIEWFKNLFN